MKKNEMLSPDEQVEYILTDISSKKYDILFGWEIGTVLKRVSIWYPGRGSLAKQAYFARVDQPYAQEIVWSDHVREVTGQLELEI